MHLSKIETIFSMDVGAPEPIILSSEHKLLLLFYYSKDIEQISKFPTQRDSVNDEGVVEVNFSKSIIYKFGYPNDEVLSAHPLYKLGLSYYDIFEVVGSSWIKEIEEMNTRHPLHFSKSYKLYKHYIVTFKGSTFECLAEAMNFTFKKGLTMKQALKQSCETFI